ncbi:MAG: type I-U CRISPR-associated RAMP protein Csb1/Cas7u [Candidatus Hadarchaeum sp.]|uniref:type I-G CRISPR-associated RAMP protein Csb1/Cas7g n=1 Tax=Bacteria TaxID=2 RepID=UPI001A8E0616|nr:type I-U CRISPR-associated RAMP protein Csb1/Cas7u [Methylacidiphilum caldifontis]QSR88746.1 type I-U CRISPR-associated protein Cas7 [Methylacidiphilum caldifontis]
MQLVEFAEFEKVIASDTAIRRRQKLQPVGGQGDKIFPPTYPPEGNGPPRHVYERRRFPDGEKWCVLVDSVQSQANRLEEALIALVEGGLSIPHIIVDFTETDIQGIGKITSLQAPHRVYDAILRDSELDGIPFLNSELGKRLVRASLADASSLLEVDPASLLFGAWHSTGQGGGLNPRFMRCLVSEIVAVDVPVEEVRDNRTNQPEIRTAARRTASRIDPLGILRGVEVYKSKTNWDTEKREDEKSQKARPSEIGHSNIRPTIEPLGITCDYIEHSFVLSFAALRRLRFGSEEKNIVGRSLIATLGLLAIHEQDRRGYALRSRCNLVCKGMAPLELIHPDGSTDICEMDLESAIKLYKKAYEEAKKAGFSLMGEPVILKPQKKLVEIVKMSQELALSGEGGQADKARTEDDLGP